ncbi:glycerol acyltransferase [Mucilaginibacter robiniae]|uniref:Glycerol acyltransferase n=1 Tax=Mucilaginibacter robiniae TaxID=2728022 RepID=A0A7L5E3B8_9SPHI|nr:1-acyl-sn-glycerol-3-phosphate acyltransferase [Mucilaginibacter robiniae]QJD97078.1 glycerol acyltransferase [Mucilaginibacter robiniae]
MIRPKENKLIHWFFHHYIRFILKRNFQKFNFNQAEVNPEKSILLIANHFGWWDGFLLYWLNYKLFKKKFHIMILEDTVREVFFLKYMGAFSITKHSRQMMESLAYAGELLQDPQNLVLIFPQGQLYSNFVDDVKFEKGLLRVVKQAAGRFQYVFAATFIEYHQHKKPTINVYVKSDVQNPVHIDELQALYQQHYHSAKLLQTQIVL